MCNHYSVKIELARSMCNWFGICRIHTRHSNFRILLTVMVYLPGEDFVSMHLVALTSICPRITATQQSQDMRSRSRHFDLLQLQGTILDLRTTTSPILALLEHICAKLLRWLCNLWSLLMLGSVRTKEWGCLVIQQFTWPVCRVEIQQQKGGGGAARLVWIDPLLDDDKTEVRWTDKPHGHCSP